MEKTSKKTKTSVRVGKFAIIGAILALFNFVIYTFLARVIFNSNELLWLDSIISYALATILAYILHSKITWKERSITKRGIFMFFFWNGLTALAISPFFTWLFGFIKPVYEFAHNISSGINLPFDYAFVESTGIFCFTTCVTMILNYLFYDKLVFGDQTSTISYQYTPELSKNKVSIIVPIYNAAKYLPTCLDSILAQTHDNLEIILVNDGSTDNSSEIIKQYAKKDKRIKTIHQKNQGQSAARNAGLKKATGKFISFIDADDKFKPTFIADLLAPYSEDTTYLSVCGIHYKRLRQESAEDVYINPLRARRERESFKAYILYLLAVDGRMYSSVNKLYRAEIAKSQKFDDDLNFAEDTKFVLDYLAATEHVATSSTNHDTAKSSTESDAESTATHPTNSSIAFVLKPDYIYNFGTETSTMRSVSTDWQNWQVSYANLKSWLGDDATIKEKFWLHTVHLRWRISYLRSKRRVRG